MFNLTFLLSSLSFTTSLDKSMTLVNRVMSVSSVTCQFIMPFPSLCIEAASKVKVSYQIQLRNYSLEIVFKFLFNTYLMGFK